MAADQSMLNILLSRPEIGLHKKSKLMDIKRQAVHEYLTQGFTYRQLAIKYGVSRSTINM
jgi:hypothetical protein